MENKILFLEQNKEVEHPPFFSKISKKNIYNDNEFFISSLLFKIPNFYHSFSPILNQYYADIYNLNNKNINLSTLEFKKCSFINNAKLNKKKKTSKNIGFTNTDTDIDKVCPYIYNKFRFIGNNTIQDYLNETNLNETNLEELFLYLKYSISLLYNNNIVHNNINGNNIIIHYIHKIPIITNFSFSISIDNIIHNIENEADMYTQINPFFLYNPSSEIHAPEFLFISYLLHNKNKLLIDKENITTQDIQFVYNDFSNYNNIFKNKLMNEIRTEFLNSLYSFLNTFNNKPIKHTIIYIIQNYYKTWDMYSLVISLIYKNVIDLPQNYMKYISANPNNR